jgi:hypothetical protein
MHGKNRQFTKLLVFCNEPGVILVREKRFVNIKTRNRELPVCFPDPGSREFPIDTNHEGSIVGCKPEKRAGGAAETGTEPATGRYAMAITLLDMLHNAGLITREQFDEALNNRVLFGGKIGTSLIELGHVREDDLARFLSIKLAVPFIAAERLLAIPPEIIQLIPRGLALTYRVIPLHRDKKRLYLVMSDPADLKAIDDIAFITGFIIKPVIAPEVRLIQALGKYYDFEVDHRYQQIIIQIEEERQSARPAPPVTFPPDMMSTHVSPAKIPDTVPEASAGFEKELEEAEIVDEEEWVKRVGHYSIDKVSKTLARAEDREEIAGTLIDYLGQKFERVALFVIRGVAAFGWKGVTRGSELLDFDKFVIPLDGPSVLRTVAEGQGYYVGTIPENDRNNLMLSALGGGNPGVALLLPLVITGRVVTILYLDGGDGALGDRFIDLQRLLAKAVLAFEILIFREKILMLQPGRLS